MTAAIDFGNTAAKLGFFDGHTLVSNFTGLTEAQLIVILRRNKPTAMMLSSVVHSATDLHEAFADFPQKLILNRTTPLPIVNGYATPDTLGYDRLAAVVGAFARFPAQNIVVIDMGTAIKYDFINAKGVFKGGIISPGMQMRFNALNAFTEKLPLLSADGIPELIGDSTATCIQSGVVNGIIAEMNGIIERYNQYPNLRVVLCGGDAAFFESLINYPKFAASNLVLEGLNRILLHNVEKNQWAI